LSDIIVFFAGRDGQTRKISARVVERARAVGLDADLRDLRETTPSAEETRAARLPVLIAAIRYGYHLPEMTRFIKERRADLTARPFVFASVNLTARKPGKSTVEGNVYLRKYLKRHALAPILPFAIAGKLDYQRYLWWERLMIQLIMTISGGPTDPTAVVEYTDWDAVDAFADRLIEATRRGG